MLEAHRASAGTGVLQIETPPPVPNKNIKSQMDAGGDVKMKIRFVE